MSKLNLGDSLILDTDITVGGGEVKTGATWNGKPVYAKAISGTSGSEDGYFSVQTGITNGYEFVDICGCLKGASWFLPVGYNDPSTIFTPVVHNDLTSISCYLKGGSDYRSKPVYFVIYYTKTTD